MNKIHGIKKSIFTHYYKLDWSMDYGKTNEKVYLAIKGKLDTKPILHLEVRNASQLWQDTGRKNKIERITRKEFIKNANGGNVAKFYSFLPENNLLKYSPKIWQEMSQFMYSNNNYGKSHTKAIKKNNKESVRNELKELKRISQTKLNNVIKNRKIER